MIISDKELAQIYCKLAKAFGISLEKPYKVYTVTALQSGTGDPVINVLENTLGNIVWTRQNSGDYQGVLAGAFTQDKVFIVVGPSIRTGANFTFIRPDDDTILLGTLDADGIADDDLLYNTSIEIRVYN
jgi:hypothetical protein